MELYLVIPWIISILVLLIFLIISVRSGNRDEFKEILPWFLLSFTPAGIFFTYIIGGLLVLCGIFMLLEYLAECLMDLIFGNKQ